MPNQTVGFSPRRISADHLKLALAVAKGRRLGVLTSPPFAALSNGATPLSCRERHGDAMEEHPSTRRTHPPLFLPMLASITPAMVDRVRTQYGLDEVRATWGMGYRALMAELNGKKAVAS